MCSWHASVGEESRVEAKREENVSPMNAAEARLEMTDANSSARFTYPAMASRNTASKDLASLCLKVLIKAPVE